MKFPPRSSYWLNSTSAAGSSRSMRSTVKKTFAIAAARGADLIVQLKANQKSLCRQVKGGCAKSSPATTFQSVDRQKRNRHETRRSVFAALRHHLRSGLAQRCLGHHSRRTDRPELPARDRPVETIERDHLLPLQPPPPC